VAYAGNSCAAVRVWDPLARRDARTPRLCRQFPGGGNGVGQLALAGERLAWLDAYESNSGTHIELWTLRLGTRRPTLVTATLAGSDEGTSGSACARYRDLCVGSAWFERLLGGSTIAFTLEGGGKSGIPTSLSAARRRQAARTVRRSAWLLLEQRADKCPWTDDPDPRPRSLCRRLSFGDAVSVDAGRVLTVQPHGVVSLLSTDGRVLRTWKAGANVDAAVLQGRTVVVQRGASVVAYDSGTGAKRATRLLASDEGTAKILDVQGGLAVYATGGAIHLLRLSDGRDRALALPQAAPPLDARLDPKGLFVTWNRMYDHRPGRVAFVPLRAIEQALGRS
jgi:hypothetical protein